MTCDRTALDRMAEALSREGFADFTLHQSLSAQFACLLLDELVTKIEEWRQKDEDTRALLKHGPELNQRQRSIIGRALRHPGATFTIKYHQTNNAKAYATARRDLVELEQKGYLSFEVDGRTMVFKAASTLDSLIG